MKNFILNNIPIHATTKEKIYFLLDHFLLESKKPKIITTFNLDFLRIAYTDKVFNNICSNAMFNLPDGFGITSLIRFKFNIKVERITGNDLFPILLDIVKNNNLRVVVVGGSVKVSNLAKTRILKEVKIDEKNLLFLSPMNNFENNKNLNNQLIENVSTFEPNIVFAALGCPRQEKWLYDNMNKFGSSINVGIGATLDYYSGVKSRSPLLFQKFGLEWLWRLILEPRRLFKRYIMKDIPFYFKAILKIKGGKNF